MKQRKIVEIICGVIAILFVYAAISKLLDYNAFRMQLSQSPFITGFSKLITWVLPIIEITIGLLLAYPPLRLLGLYTSLFLLSLFTAYLVAMLNFSYYIPCSCGGVLSSLSWRQHIYLNLAFILITIAGIHYTSINQETIEIKYKSK